MKAELGEQYDIITLTTNIIDFLRDGNIGLNKIAHSTFFARGGTNVYSATRCKAALRTIFFQTLVCALRHGKEWL